MGNSKAKICKAKSEHQDKTTTAGD